LPTFAGLPAVFPHGCPPDIGLGALFKVAPALLLSENLPCYTTEGNECEIYTDMNLTLKKKKISFINSFLNKGF
jgi:hypothetical protein